MKVVLEKEMETLLIPLYGRAQMSRAGIFRDAQAEYALEHIDYPFERLHIQKKVQVFMALRAKRIDAYAQDFLKKHPDAAVLYLGCGLDARAQRLGYPGGRWYDLDYPEVIAIKAQLFEETPRYRFIASSVTDWSWMDAVTDGREQALVIAEGLLMYLHEEDVRALFEKLLKKFPQVTFLFDAYSKTTAKYAKHQPSLKQTGAQIHWGVDSPHEMERMVSGLRHVDTLYFTAAEYARPLSMGYRMMFRIAGCFRAAREAHRIFVMKKEA